MLNNILPYWLIILKPITSLKEITIGGIKMAIIILYNKEQENLNSAVFIKSP